MVTFAKNRVVRGLVMCSAILSVAVSARAIAQTAQAPVATVYLENMTWTELGSRIAGGATTALVPIGGTEQSGPHMVLGKHNVRAHLLAGKIAARLGNAVVAPVISYVPEGAINPPIGHMRFAGTISVPDATFESVLDATARSLCQHGFRYVFFLGDHGGYQRSEEKVAANFRQQKSDAISCHVYALTEYYDATQKGYVADLKRKGFSDAEIGMHAGLADTSLSLALDPALVRPRLLGTAAAGGSRNGVRGDPARASAELGQMGVERIIDTSVLAIRTTVASQAPRSGSGNQTKKTR